MNELDRAIKADIMQCETSLGLMASLSIISGLLSFFWKLMSIGVQLFAIMYLVRTFVEMVYDGPFGQCSKAYRMLPIDAKHYVLSKSLIMGFMSLIYSGGVSTLALISSLKGDYIMNTVIIIPAADTFSLTVKLLLITVSEAAMYFAIMMAGFAGVTAYNTRRNNRKWIAGKIGAIIYVVAVVSIMNLIKTGITDWVNYSDTAQIELTPGIGDLLINMAIFMGFALPQAAICFSCMQKYLGEKPYRREEIPARREQIEAGTQIRENKISRKKKSHPSLAFTKRRLKSFGCEALGALAIGIVVAKIFSYNQFHYDFYPVLLCCTGATLLCGALHFKELYGKEAFFYLSVPVEESLVVFINIFPPLLVGVMIFVEMIFGMKLCGIFEATDISVWMPTITGAGGLCISYALLALECVLLGYHLTNIVIDRNEVRSELIPSFIGIAFITLGTTLLRTALPVLVSGPGAVSTGCLTATIVFIVLGAFLHYCNVRIMRKGYFL